MIVYDLNVPWTWCSVQPIEANAPLVIDSDTPLPFAVTDKLFQPMAS